MRLIRFKSIVVLPLVLLIRFDYKRKSLICPYIFINMVSLSLGVSFIHSSSDRRAGSTASSHFKRRTEQSKAEQIAFNSKIYI